MNVKNSPHYSLFIHQEPSSHFTSFREIGSGSFGCVFHAIDIKTNISVALKRILYSEKNRSEVVEDILKEITILSKLSHPCIVSYISSYINEKEDVWIVLEYCLGSTYDFMKAVGSSLEEKYIFAIMESTIYALIYLHSFSYIHRDVKAKNILISDSGKIKLADFGSASLKPRTNSFVGSPYWMAPEILNAMEQGDYDSRVDIWSMGITCIELSEEDPPYYKLNPMSALYQITQNNPPELNPDKYSVGFVDFVKKCLQKDPTNRPTLETLLENDIKPFLNENDTRKIMLELVDQIQHIFTEKEKTVFEDIDDKSSEGDSEMDSLVSEMNRLNDELDNIGNIAEDSDSPSTDVLDREIKRQTCKYYETFKKQNGQGINDKKNIHLKDVEFNTCLTPQKIAIMCIEEYIKEKEKEGFEILRRLVRTQQKDLITIQEKHKQQMSDCLKSIQKDFMTKMSNYDDEMTRLKLKHTQILDDFIKKTLSSEKSLLTTESKRSLSNIMSTISLNSDSSTRVSQNDLREKTDNPPLNSPLRGMTEKKSKNLIINKNDSLTSQRRMNLKKRQELETVLLREEMDLLFKQMEESHKLFLGQHNTLKSLQLSQLDQLQNLRISQMNAKFEMEVNRYITYSSEYLKAINKQYLVEMKQLPKRIKKQIDALKKETNENIKKFTISHKQETKLQFNTLIEMDQKLSYKSSRKTELHSIIKKMKETQKLQIDKLLNEENNEITTSHTAAIKKLNEESEITLKNLKENHNAYLVKIRNNMDIDREKLLSQIQERHTLLMNKFTDERENYFKYSESRNVDLEKRTHEDWDKFAEIFEQDNTSIPFKSPQPSQFSSSEHRKP